MIALDIPNSCVARELEMLQESINEKHRRREIAEADLLVNQFYEVTNTLGINRRCTCQDRSCSQWDGNFCHCSGNPYCNSLRFEFRLVDRRPTKSEMEIAKREIPSLDLAQKRNEPFIVWKTRSESLVWNLAMIIHDTPEDGSTDYIYAGSGNPEARLRQFFSYISDIRAIEGRGRSTRNSLTAVVGCSVCFKVFRNESFLNAHVDRYRAEGDSLHLTANMITPTSALPVRPTDPSYRPPPRPIPPSPTEPAVRDSLGLISHFQRDSSWDENTWIDALRDTVQDYRHDYSRAIGCFRCGDIFDIGTHLAAHVFSAHENSTTISATTIIMRYGIT